ncbi:CoA transferase [Mesorhizobium sp. GR13]|uniref:CaiB/BaiF CoA transferase family protein n=1 Tax=Mesorhizobium sp. GR13 TaxID=2562308 RepID=UPI0024848295|nr:CoA transferase [Mesorhizobium sp. GR13]
MAGDSNQILAGITVLDCTVAMAGPFAAQRLGDIGANVIKVEPVEGEWQRRMAAGGGEDRKINASFLSLNRNKRSLAINLKSEEGRAAIHKLVKSADVFLQNYRPHVAAKLGVDYDTLKAINPRLIYVSISGYGADGPYANRAGQDLIVQGLSGSMYSSGTRNGPPQPSGQYVVDATTAYCAFEGALAALFHRERTGEAQRVDINMLDAALAFQMQEISVFTIDGKIQERTDEPHAHVFIRAPYSAFPTKNGYVTIAFPPLAKLGEVFDEPRFLAMDDAVDTFARRDEIHRLVAEHTAKWDRDELLAALLKHDIWSGPVHDYQAVLDDPQVRHNGSFVEYEHHSEGQLKTPGFPIHFSRTPSRVDRGAPLVGEHSREILKTAGYGDSEINELIAKGVIGEN